MKALNRAIARTVSQINRITTPDSYYLPLLDKLREHLDALLEMERKQLELAGTEFSSVRVGDVAKVTVTKCRQPGLASAAIAEWAKALATENDGFREHVGTPLQSHQNDNAQGATSAPEQWPPSIPPWLWRTGDALLCNTEFLRGFTKGNHYVILNISAAGNCLLQDDEGKDYDISGTCAKFFTNYTRREVAA